MPSARAMTPLNDSLPYRTKASVELPRMTLTKLPGSDAQLSLLTRE